VFYELLLQLKAFVSTIKTQQLKIIDRETCKTNIETWNVMTAKCLLWTLSSVMSHPRFENYYHCWNRASLIFTCKQKRNEIVERWQRYLTGWGLCKSSTICCHDWEQLFKQSLFYKRVKTEDMWFKHKYQLCLNY